MNKAQKSEKFLFNFYSLVGVRLQTDCPFARDFFLSQYKCYKVNTLPDHLPCVYLHFSSMKLFSPGSPKGYTRHTHKLFATFDYKIQFSGHHISVNVIGNRISIPIVHHILLHGCLRYLVSNNKGIMLHASAVSRDGQSLLFAGPSGYGKTTIAAMIAARTGNGWRFFSDDYVFWIPGNRSLSYDTPLHMNRHLMHYLPELRSHLGAHEMLRIHLYGYIRKVSREKIKWPVRIDSSRFWTTDSQGKVSTTMALMLISPAADGRFQATAVKPKAELIDKISDMNFRELTNFLFLVQKSDSIADFAAWKNKWRTREAKKTESLMDTVDIFQLKCPWPHQRVRSQTVDQFIKFIDAIDAGK